MIQLASTLLLASGSPRRKEILQLAGFAFEVQTKDIDEVYPPEMALEQVPAYLAKVKASAFEAEARHKIVLTSDTVVIVENKIFGKPDNADHAFEMLKTISGTMHEVVSGVCIRFQNKEVIFSDISRVYFKSFTDNEINYYIENYKPFDKAGAYGVQEWIGMIGIEKIEGSFYNVMGLPIHLVYKELMNFRLN
ncbi:MAG: Maf family nucleotide pyrophosphatase [Cytophagales bacterium]